MARKRKKTGNKHRIIFIRHSLNRVWRTLFVADVILWGAWWMAPYTKINYFSPPNDVYLFLGALLLFVLVVMALLLRNSGFVQARNKYVLLAIPFFRIRIPYENIENVRMVRYQDLWEKKGLSWANRRFMRAYRHQTVATINLNQYPVSEFLLKLFLPNYLFLPEGRGFLIYTKYYLEFNTEVDSRLNEARTTGALQPTRKDKITQTDQDEVYDGYFDIFDQG